MADVKISALPTAGAITGAELVPIVQGGITSRSTVSVISNGDKKVYRAIIDQSGSSAPTATVLENTLGGTVVWSRNNAGEYIGTLSGAFPFQKTIWNTPQYNLAYNNFANGINFFRVDSNTMEIDTLLNGVLVDGQLNEQPIEILVYP